MNTTKTKPKAFGTIRSSQKKAIKASSTSTRKSRRKVITSPKVPLTTEIPYSTPKLSIERIGPNKASEYLLTNNHNRHLSATLIAKMSADMVEGRWLELRDDPIRFHENGSLISGQHRLHAVITSGKTLQFFTQRGLTSRDAQVVDTQRSRSVSDALLWEGDGSTRDGAVRAAAVRMWLLAKTGSRKIVSSSSLAASNLSLIDTMNNLDNFNEAIAYAKEAKANTGVRPRVAAFIYLAAMYMDKTGNTQYNMNRTADLFLEKFSSGDMLEANNPILVARNSCASTARTCHARAADQLNILWEAFISWRNGETWGRRPNVKKENIDFSLLLN